MNPRLRKPLVLIALVGMLLAAVLAPLAELQQPGRGSVSTASLNKLLFFPAAYPIGQWQPTDLDFQDIGFGSAVFPHRRR